MKNEPMSRKVIKETYAKLNYSNSYVKYFFFFCRNIPNTYCEYIFFFSRIKPIKKKFSNTNAPGKLTIHVYRSFIVGCISVWGVGVELKKSIGIINFVSIRCKTDIGATRATRVVRTSFVRTFV